jgi:hypothetical protein
LESGEEQGPSKSDPVLLSEIKTSTIHRNLRADQKFLKAVAVLS